LSPATKSLAAALGLLAAVGIGLAVALGGGSARLARGSGCVQLTVASTTGGAQISACGPKARALCAQPGQLRTSAALEASCRRAGFGFATG